MAAACRIAGPGHPKTTAPFQRGTTILYQGFIVFHCAEAERELIDVANVGRNAMLQDIATYQALNWLADERRLHGDNVRHSHATIKHQIHGRSPPVGQRSQFATCLEQSCASARRWVTLMKR